MKLFFAFWLLGFAALALEGNLEADLKVLFLIDNQSHLIGDDLNTACAINMAGLHQAFTNAAHARMKTYQAWGVRGFNLSEASALKTLRGMKFGTADTLVIYYCGHGIMPSINSHSFKTSGGTLYRATLQAELKRISVRQKLLISDTCSARPARAQRLPKFNAREPEILSDLLFASEGTADLSAAEPGALAWFDSEFGGMFTQAWLEVTQQPRNGFDLNQDGRVSWQEIFPSLAITTNRNFLALKKQNPNVPGLQQQIRQMPIYWQLPN